jgi:hypothetical protein
MRLFLVALALVSAPTLAHAQYGRDRCKLTVAEAPAIRGFSLGMPMAQAVARFESVKAPKSDEFGVAALDIFPKQVASANPVYDGVKRIFIYFVDEKLSVLSVMYEAKEKWKNEGEYLDAVRESLGLKGGWSFDMSRNLESAPTFFHSMECEGFVVRAGLSGRSAQEPFIVLEDLAAREKVVERKAAKEKKDSEARKKTFKP